MIGCEQLSGFVKYQGCFQLAAITTVTTSFIAIPVQNYLEVEINADLQMPICVTSLLATTKLVIASHITAIIKQFNCYIVLYIIAIEHTTATYFVVSNSYAPSLVAC